MIPEIARGVDIFSEGWFTSVMMISFLIQVLFRHMQVDIFYNKGEQINISILQFTSTDKGADLQHLAKQRIIILLQK